MKIDRYKIKMIVLLSFLFIYNISFSTKILSEAEVEGTKVYLSDLIITTESSVFEKASKITITRLPNPGEYIEISGNVVASKLRPLTNKKLIIPKTVKIRRSFEIATRESLEKIIDVRLEKFYENRPDISYGFTLKTGRKLRVPVGQVEYKLQESKLNKYRFGKYQVYLELYQNGEIAQSLPFVLEVKKIISEYKLIKDVSKGEEFSESHLSLDQREVFYDIKKENFSVEEARGNVYKSDLSAGYKIKNEDIGGRIVISKGKVVKVELNYKGIIITDMVEALEDGKAGETIALKNIRSGKRIQGTVMADGTIKVEY